MDSTGNVTRIRPIRVLLIEDDNATRALYRAYLEDALYEVREASDGASGARMVDEFKPDIVITDIFLPDKDGLQVILETKSEDDDIKFIAISGGTGRVEGHEYLAIAELFGAAKTLHKPFDKQTLLNACNEVTYAAAAG